MALHLNQILLSCSDIERSIAFYTGLGLQMIVRSSDHGKEYARFVAPGNQVTFSLLGNVPVVPSGSEIAFECDDLDAQVAALKARGYVFESGPTDQSWLWREAHLKDPDGHALMLFHAGENRLNPPWRLAETRR